MTFSKKSKRLNSNINIIDANNTIEKIIDEAIIEDIVEKSFVECCRYIAERGSPKRHRVIHTGYADSPNNNKAVYDIARRRGGIDEVMMTNNNPVSFFLFNKIGNEISNMIENDPETNIRKTIKELIQSMPVQITNIMIEKLKQQNLSEKQIEQCLKEFKFVILNKIMKNLISICDSFNLKKHILNNFGQKIGLHFDRKILSQHYLYFFLIKKYNRHNGICSLPKPIIKKILNYTNDYTYEDEFSHDTNYSYKK